MFLDTITNYKKTVIENLKKAYSYQELERLALQREEVSLTKSFAEALSTPSLSLIAEVKKGSPSKGIIRHEFNHLQIAQDFEQHGASALSILTEEKFFFGNNQYLTEIQKIVTIPLLRKDFILDEIQILESKVIGADAILLIAAILNKKQISDYYSLAKSLKMDVLCEVHNQEELEMVLDTPCEIIGINNRDLKSFQVDINTTITLQRLIPKEKTIVCESGITTTEQLSKINQHNIHAVLIGEGLATNPDLLHFWTSYPI